MLEEGCVERREKPFCVRPEGLGDGRGLWGGCSTTFCGRGMWFWSHFWCGGHRVEGVVRLRLSYAEGLEVDLVVSRVFCVLVGCAGYGRFFDRDSGIDPIPFSDSFLLAEHTMYEPLCGPPCKSTCIAELDLKHLNIRYGTAWQLCLRECKGMALRRMA